jgi:hypothetical protein
MLFCRKLYLFSAFFLVLFQMARAQTPADAVLMKGGEFCGGLFYQYVTWDEYWQADSLLHNGNIGRMNTQIITAGFALGITDYLNVYASLPFVSNQPTGGWVEGTAGIQDAGLFAKARFVNTKAGKGQFQAFVSGGASIPASRYIPEHPFAIGNGAVDVLGRLIAAYQGDMGLYGRAGVGYRYRGNSEIVRGSYFTTQAFQSNIIDMPNALDVNAAIGYFRPKHQFKVEGECAVLRTLGGFDIRYWDMMFPSNKRQVLQLGGNVQYIPDWGKGFGLHVNANTVVLGRNVPKSVSVGAGITYFFQAWGKDKAS